MAKDKKTGQYKHAKMRALQRYDLDLRNHDIDQIVRAIIDGKIISAKAQTNRVTIIDMMWTDVRIRVAYDKQRKSIASFLPLEGMPDYREGVL